MCSRRMEEGKETGKGNWWNKKIEKGKMEKRERESGVEVGCINITK